MCFGHPDLVSTDVQSWAHQQLVPVYLPKCLSPCGSLEGCGRGHTSAFIVAPIPWKAQDALGSSGYNSRHWGSRYSVNWQLPVVGYKYGTFTNYLRYGWAQKGDSDRTHPWVIDGTSWRRMSGTTSLTVFVSYTCLLVDEFIIFSWLKIKGLKTDHLSHIEL